MTRPLDGGPGAMTPMMSDRASDPAGNGGAADAPPAPAPELSLVIPAYNERESIVPLFTELREALAGVGRSYEIVAVDDGSRDGTGEWLVREATRDPRVVPLLLAANSGQSAALAAGIRRARGAVIV